jgi:hypothetical protein
LKSGRPVSPAALAGCQSNKRNSTTITQT